MERNREQQDHEGVALATTTAGALDRLDLEAVREAVEASTSANTRRACAGALRRFAAFLAERGLDLGQQDAERQDATVGVFLAHRAEACVSPATLSQDYAAIGAAGPATRGPSTERAVGPT